MSQRHALEGIRVLDLSTALAEATGRVFADLGAQVIKIEPPGGCDARYAAPFAKGVDSDSGDPEGSLFWRVWGRGKRSVELDIHDAGDRDRLLALVRTADVFIESFAPGELDALGLGPDALRAANPLLLYVSVTPFGATGPFAKHPATDLTLSAAGGLLNMQGDGDRPPVPVGFPETVHLGAVQAAADAILALYARNRTGTGQHLDTSIQAAVLWSLMYVTDYAALDQDPPGTDDTRTSRIGSTMPVLPGLTLPVIEPCKDGFVAMALVLGAQGAFGFNAAMNWIGEQGGLDDDLLDIDWMTWIQQIQEEKLPLETALRAVEQFKAFLKTMTKAEIQEQAVKQKWLISPVNTAPDLLGDVQLRARDFWVDVDGDTLPGPFAILGETPIRYEGPAPKLGADQHLVDDLDRTPVAPSSHPRVELAPREQLFEGLKVADFSWIAAGPLITKDLANLGATVLRVETESRVDTLRFIPPFVGDPGVTTGHVAANMNQSKYGIALDFTNPRGLEIAHKMVEWADVVVENFTPGTAERLGLDYATLREKKPDIVMLYTCMRGQTGPERKHTGFGLHGAALGGFCAITGWPDRKPIPPWGAYTDFISPRYALSALGAALHHRDRTGEGQCIGRLADRSLDPLPRTDDPRLRRERPRRRTGGPTTPIAVAPHSVYATSQTERYVAVEVRTPEQWARAVRRRSGGGVARGSGRRTRAAVGADRAPRRDRRRRRRLVRPSATASTVRSNWREAGVPAYAVLRARDFHGDRQLADRGFFIELDHAGFGRSTFDGAVTTFSDTPAAPRWAGPLIGQHTFEVMKDVLGYDEDEIAEIAASGALS